MQVMDASFDPMYGEAWNRRQISEALSMPSTHAIVVDAAGDEIEGELLLPDPRLPAGFVLTRHAADEEELLLIAVMPEWRGLGLGHMLFKHLFDHAKARRTNRIYLEMRRGNPAIHLYQKVGFEPIGERPNYYRFTNGNRVDAITFGRSI